MVVREKKDGEEEMSTYSCALPLGCLLGGALAWLLLLPALPTSPAPLLRTEGKHDASMKEATNTATSRFHHSCLPSGKEAGDTKMMEVTSQNGKGDWQAQPRHGYIPVP